MTATAVRAGRSRRFGLWSTTIGKKLLVAVTGLGWIGFVLVHMIGNLKLFLGAEGHGDRTPALNVYSEWLRDLGTPALPRTMLLWFLRFGLIAMFFGHVALVAILSYRNRAARPVRYARTAHVQANPASLMMKWGGVTILAFLFFHLAQFTWGVSPDIRFRRGDPYGNVTQAFYHRPWMGAVYLVAMVALAGHLYHGVYSTAQTLGVNRARWERLVRRTAIGAAAVIAGGNVVIIVGATFLAHPGY
ncbi:MAG: succinate dehydrogenase cytochrome b subunit [Actinomycetota bacterium]|nr:succinate dehydrogenase cytochrome b subunit [Actinomycetota bacterium]